MRLSTLSGLAALALVVAPHAEAQCTGTAGTDFQQVTIRQINAIPQTNIDALNAASTAGTLTVAEMQTQLTNDLEDELVEFQAVFLSDPLLSGLANSTAGIPNRIHAFVRDVNALADGVEGMGVQIVDNRGDGQIQNFVVGDEVVVCGFVSPFEGGGKTMQIAPVSITTATAPVVDTQEEEDAILAPVVITTDDIHDAVGSQTQIDFDVYSDFNGQFVRFEGITVVQGVQGARPNVLLQSPTQDTQINVYDTSVCFRNDRDESYFPSGLDPDCIDDDFVPPPTGTANVQGFLTWQGDDGGFNYAIPDPANFVISPIEEADFVVTEAPPTVSVASVDVVPGPTDDVMISADVVPAQGTITTVVADFRYVIDGADVQTGQVTLTNSTGDTYTGMIPARTEADANGAFVAFSVTGTDDGSLSTTSGEVSYRVFDGAVTSIALVQETFDGGPGASPLVTGSAATFNLDAVVQTAFQRGDNFYATLQDDADLDPFTGVWVFFGATDPGLSPGDQINITEATIVEQFDVTQLTDVTFTTTGTGTPFPFKEVPTGVLTDDATAEAHEGMLLSFDDVTIISNDTGFGEWSFATAGVAGDAIEADDWADGIAEDYASTTFTDGEVRDFIRGIWWFSFGEYKLVPVTTADIGGVVVALEGDLETDGVRIVGSFPNPAASEARIHFEVATTTDVSLRLFDVTGREVATLADGVYAAAAHDVTADLSGLSAGVYVLRLDAGGEVATARLSIVR
ncbi:MAG: T9SS type A sorting domain-containing protein [Bacteroidota bacterium]